MQSIVVEVALLTLVSFGLSSSLLSIIVVKLKQTVPEKYSYVLYVSENEFLGSTQAL